MKKVLALLSTFCIFISVVGCGSAVVEKSCAHQWQDATCERPSTCSLCGETKGAEKGHKWMEATCTQASTCIRCATTKGSAKGHDYHDGYCGQCGAKDPSYIARDDIFPGTPKLSFDMNSVGGISFYWKQNYIKDKTIHYITVTYTLYDAVGNPTPDDIHHESTRKCRLIGPFEGKEAIEFSSDVFVYCDVCHKVSFDSLYVEFADGTTATIRYGWNNTVQ